MSVRTTKRQYALFEKEVRRWLSVLGLQDWVVYCCHGRLEPGNFAHCEYVSGHRKAYIRLNTHLSDESVCTVSDIRRVALHEVLELLLSPCGDIMREARPWEQVNTEVHKVIRVLENVLIGDPK